MQEKLYSKIQSITHATFPRVLTEMNGYATLFSHSQTLIDDLGDLSDGDVTDERATLAIDYVEPQGATLCQAFKIEDDVRSFKGFLPDIKVGFSS